MLRSLLTCLALILLATPAIAADARAHVSIEIAPDGFVSIKQKWDGIVALDRLQYDTGTDELGVLDAVVFEGHSELDYASYELLRRDGDRLRLVIAQLDYLGNWLDFDLSVRYPANLEFINADPEPSFQSSEAHGLMWSMADRRELILIASFSGQLEAGGGKSARFGSASEADLRREAQDEALRRLEAELTGEVRGNSGNGESGNSGNTGSSSAIDRSGGQGSSAGNAGQNAGGQTEAAPASTSANDGSRMLRPGEDAEVIDPDIVIAPLAAFDRRGIRLGYGAGHYDRALARLDAAGPVTTIGVAFALQQEGLVPAERTDRPLDRIVTEHGVLVADRAP